MIGSDIYVDLNRKPKVTNDPYSRIMEESSSLMQTARSNLA